MDGGFGVGGGAGLGQTFRLRAALHTLKLSHNSFGESHT